MAATLNTNIQRLWQLMQPSYGDIAIVAVYTFFIGLFFLAVPLTASALEFRRAVKEKKEGT